MKQFFQKILAALWGFKMQKTYGRSSTGGGNGSVRKFCLFRKDVVASYIVQFINTIRNIF